jgi:hypothetical protein
MKYSEKELKVIIEAYTANARNPTLAAEENGRAAYAHDLRRLGRRLVVVVNQLACQCQPVGCQLRLAPEFHAPALCILHPGPRAFGYQRVFELG